MQALARAFFFIFYFPRLDLHAFPTRRSSDLARRRASAARRARPSRRWPGESDPSRRPPNGERRVDRKSTRLNSSHTVISYAVFCLKKKSVEERAVDDPARPPGHCAETAAYAR